MANQVVVWLDELKEFRRYPSWKTLQPDAAWFINTFVKQLKLRPTTGRANIVSPLTYSLKSLFRRRGLTVDPSAAHVVMREKFGRPSDISFTHGGKLWVFEVKTTLEFNSLGAALLEAMVFKAHNRDCVFALFSLYAKNVNGDLLDALTFAKLKRIFDHAFVLGKTMGDWTLYYENFANNLNIFVNSLPR